MTDAIQDYARSRAILIGTGAYAHLPAVPAALNSLARMADVLTGDLCGWPRECVSVLADQRRPGDLPDQLVQLFGEAEDVALFYYVGHGLVDSSDKLCLSLVESSTAAARRRTTSLSFDDVRYALQQSRAKTKVVILDCCYAGLAAPGLGADDVLDRVRGTGAYTLAAAGEFERAWFETDKTIANPQTYFTKYLTDVIEHGISGEGPYLTLEPIFHEAADALARDNKPVPTSGSAGYASRLTFARNAAAAGDSGFQDGEPELPDYSRSNAILIGTAVYKDPQFPRLPAAARSLSSVTQILTDPDLCGWPTERVTVLEDPVDSVKVVQRVRRLARQTEDALLLYFVGHAVLTSRGDLCLVISGTEADDSDITAVGYELVRQALSDSPARSKTVILDCSFAGRASSEGTSYLLTATAGTYQAHSPPEQEVDACTSFTGEFLDVVRAGIRGNARHLTLSDIYPRLRHGLQQRGLPTPTKRSTDDADQIAFTRNAAAPGAAPAKTRPSPGVPATAPPVAKTGPDLRLRSPGRPRKSSVQAHGTFSANATVMPDGVDLTSELGGESMPVTAPGALRYSGGYVLQKWQKNSGERVKQGDPLYQYSSTALGIGLFQARADGTGILCGIRVGAGQQFEPSAQLAVIRKNLARQAKDNQWLMNADVKSIDELAKRAEYHRQRGDLGDYRNILEYVGRHRSAAEIHQFIGSLHLAGLPASAALVGNLARTRDHLR